MAPQYTALDGSVSGRIYQNSHGQVIAATSDGIAVSLPMNAGNELGTLEITMVKDCYNKNQAYVSNIQRQQDWYGVGDSGWNKYRISGMKFHKKMMKLQNAVGDYGWATASITQSYQWSTNNWDAGTTTCYHDWQSLTPVTIIDKWKTQIKKNLTPSLESRNAMLMLSNASTPELRARMLLRDLIGDEEFKRYLVRGFIVVKGKTGIIYKVPGGHERIVSYVKDASGKYKPFERFCIVFKSGNLPHTDSVVMRKLLLESDEFELRKMANVDKSTETRPKFNGALFQTIPLLKVAV